MKKIILAPLLITTLFFTACEDKPAKKIEKTKQVVEIDKKKLEQTRAKKPISVKEKKERFIKLLLPNAKKVYLELREQYIEIQALLETNPEDPRISKLKKIYKITTNEELLLALKPHPISLTLSQAAMESSWATSRFFNVANNVFGVWSFNKNEPRIAAGEKRGTQTIWVRKYDSIEASVRGYYKLLGRSKAFKKFRLIRAASNDPKELVKGLDKYSEKGAAYGEELWAVIQYNKFEQYDFKE